MSRQIKMSDNILGLAPTPVYHHRFSDNDSLNAALADLAFSSIPHERLYVGVGTDLRQKSRPLFRGPVTEDCERWEDPFAEVPQNGFLDIEHGAIQALKRMIQDAAEELNEHARPVGAEIFGSWVQAYRDGEFLEPHTHLPPQLGASNVFWSGAYYIDAGAPDPEVTYSGVLSLLVGGSVFHFRPRPGLLVIWPSHVTHCVNPFKGQGTRLMVSFNLRLTAKQMQVLGQDLAAPR